jgi:hypothetical protein
MPHHGLSAANCYPDPRPGGEDRRGRREKERGEGGVLGIECEEHGHFIYASGMSLMASVTVSADSIMSISSRWTSRNLSKLECMK